MNVLTEEVTMDFVLQIINGLHVGSIYALIALGYTMVYGIVKLINFAHGDVIMIGSYVVLLSLTELHVPFWIAIIVAVVFCALLGMLIERFAYKPLRNASRITPLITAIGVSLLLQNIAMKVFSANPKPFPNVISGEPFQFGGVQVGQVTIYTILISVVLMVLLELFVLKTKMGKAMRAVSEDAGAATLMGININTTIAITFAIGSGLAAVGGALYSTAYPIVDPYIGSMLGLKAFIAAVLGGIGKIQGAMLGAFIIGITECLTKGYVSSQLSEAVVFAILILVLLVKPAGILGQNIREKV
ncbi:MAG: branched-chain amino acid transporter permease [Bacillales bacterium]|jgi:branched-chain amino acid transport system permease protein|nr:branched-chain amino acid transporter permease [Bacillales bacterium]